MLLASYLAAVFCIKSQLHRQQKLMCRHGMDIHVFVPMCPQVERPVEGTPR